MTSPGTPTSLRLAGPADLAALRRLAELDSADPLSGRVLVAEDGGTPVAALSLTDGRSVADPFRRTSETLALLRLRAAQLVGGTPRRLAGAGLPRLSTP